MGGIGGKIDLKISYRGLVVSYLSDWGLVESFLIGVNRTLSVGRKSCLVAQIDPTQA